MFVPRATATVESSLYAFSSFTFTNCGATGIVGPTYAQCTSAYSGTTWVSNTAYFNVVTQGFQLWTVPKSGTYLIDCIGACGGGANSTTGIGSGARMQEAVVLTKNQKLQIIVGQSGSSGSNGCSGILGGGGGGTFVVKESATYATLSGGSSNVYQHALVIAGGGGGASINTYIAAQLNASLTMKAKDGDGYNSGASLVGAGGGNISYPDPSGGGAGTGGCVPGGHGGGGLVGDGALASGADYQGKGIFRSAGTSLGYGGNGAGTSYLPNGGFGGGAAGNQYMGGGGGGLAGGGGGGIPTCSCSAIYGGGGGSSFSVIRSSAPWYGSSSENYNYTGHGSVTITFLG